MTDSSVANILVGESKSDNVPRKYVVPQLRGRTVKVPISSVVAVKKAAVAETKLDEEFLVLYRGLTLDLDDGSGGDDSEKSVLLIDTLNLIHRFKQFIGCSFEDATDLVFEAAYRDHQFFRGYDNVVFVVGIRDRRDVENIGSLRDLAAVCQSRYKFFQVEYADQKLSHAGVRSRVGHHATSHDDSALLHLAVFLQNKCKLSVLSSDNFDDWRLTIMQNSGYIARIAYSNDVKGLDEIRMPARACNISRKPQFDVVRVDGPRHPLLQVAQ